MKNSDNTMKEQVLGYILVNKNNQVLMVDDFLILYFTPIQLDSTYFSRDLVLFNNELEKNTWIKESNFSRTFLDGTKVLPNDLLNLDFCKITISKV